MHVRISKDRICNVAQHSTLVCTARRYSFYLRTILSASGSFVVAGGGRSRDYCHLAALDKSCVCVCVCVCLPGKPVGEELFLLWAATSRERRQKNLPAILQNHDEEENFSTDSISSRGGSLIDSVRSLALSDCRNLSRVRMCQIPPLPSVLRRTAPRSRC